MSLIGDLLAPYALISSPTRVIGTIFPDIVIEELHRDDLIVTDHPVEVGATISDHAFKRPAEVEMRCGWSNSKAQTEGYVQAVYSELLALQAEREPFSVTTGKRQYTNMLFASIMVTTDPQSENALSVIARLREIIITSTSTTGGSGVQSQDASANSKSSGPHYSLEYAQDATTAPVANRGAQHLASTQGAPSFASITQVPFN